MHSITKLKIPTLLGLAIIVVGIVAGVYLNFKEQVFLSQAAPDFTAQNIIITNVSDTGATISWQTTSQATAFITFGQNNPGEQTVLDDRDNLQDKAGPKPHFIHYVTLKNLLPKTTYQFKIVSGKFTSDILKFETAQPLTEQGQYTPVIGSVLDNDTPLEEGILYLSIPEAATQSAQIKASGNFLIPLSSLRTADLSDIYPLAENTVAKITVVSEKGTANLLFRLKANSAPLQPLKLGENIDLTAETPEPAEAPLELTPPPAVLNKYDLNSDGKINAADNAIVLQNFGKKFKDKKADLNGDGKVDQKDLDLMAQKIKELGSL